MRLDMHIHRHGSSGSAVTLLERMNAAGIDGGVILSEAPSGVLGSSVGNEERLDDILQFTSDCKTLYPFYWIDPTQEDAVQQVERAVSSGIVGFKTICTHFYPNDPRAIDVYHAIAQYQKPYLFHSGILYDGANPSGDFNRPCNFEVLLTIPKLRFALAHISWPWCDESIAVFGKFANYLERCGAQNAPELFMDITPGTPKLYRKDALTKLLDMPGALSHVTCGSDNVTSNYRSEYSREIQRRDDAICQEIGLQEGFLDDLYHSNAMHFLFGE